MIYWPFSSFWDQLIAWSENQVALRTNDQLNFPQSQSLYMIYSIFESHVTQVTFGASNYLNSMTSQWIKVLSSVYSKLCMCNKYNSHGRSQKYTRRRWQKLTSALQWVSSNRTSARLTQEQMFACQQFYFGYVCS